MKTAYELAMERLGKTSPTVKMTNEQKKEIAELESKCVAKIAEREIFLKQQLDATLAASNWDEAEKIKKQLAGERARLEEEKEEAKEKVRRGPRAART